MFMLGHLDADAALYKKGIPSKLRARLYEAFGENASLDRTRWAMLGKAKWHVFTPGAKFGNRSARIKPQQQEIPEDEEDMYGEDEAFEQEDDEAFDQQDDQGAPGEQQDPQHADDEQQQQLQEPREDDAAFMARLRVAALAPPSLPAPLLPPGRWTGEHVLAAPALGTPAHALDPEQTPREVESASSEVTPAFLQQLPSGAAASDLPPPGAAWSGPAHSHWETGSGDPACGPERLHRLLMPCGTLLTDAEAAELVRRCTAAGESHASCPLGRPDNESAEGAAGGSHAPAPQ